MCPTDSSQVAEKGSPCNINDNSSILASAPDQLHAKSDRANFMVCSKQLCQRLEALLEETKRKQELEISLKARSTLLRPGSAPVVAANCARLINSPKLKRRISAPVMKISQNVEVLQEESEKMKEMSTNFPELQSDKSYGLNLPNTLHMNIKEANVFQQSVKFIENERKGALRMFKHQRSMEVRKMRKIAGDIADRLTVANQADSSDVIPSPQAPPASPIATSTPSYVRLPQTAGDRRDITSPILKQMSVYPKNTMVTRLHGQTKITHANLESTDLTELTKVNNLREAPRSDVRAITRTVDSLEDLRRKSRDLILKSQAERRPPMTLPPLYLLPRGTLHCDRDSKDLVNQKPTSAIRRRLFGMELQNTNNQNPRLMAMR